MTIDCRHRIGRALLLTLITLGLVACNAAPVEQVDVAPLDVADPLVQLAEADHVAFLESCLDHYESLPVTDYTCLFLRQERLDGFLTPLQKVHVKFRAEPFSVAMTWIENPGDGDRCIYVAGQWPNRDGISQMLIRPTGGLAQMLVGGSVFRLPDGKDVMRGTLKPITQFGFQKMLTSFIGTYRQARAADDCEEKVLGVAHVAGRKCIVLQRTITHPQDPKVAPRTTIFIDRTSLLPVRVEGYKLDGELLFSYQYDEIALNVGLSEADFTPKANGIADPKSD